MPAHGVYSTNKIRFTLSFEHYFDSFLAHITNRATPFFFFFLLNDLISNVFKFFPHGFVTLTNLRAFELKKLAPLPRIISSLTALTINSLKKC